MFTRIRGVRMIIDRWGEFRFRTKRFFFCPSRSDYIASPQTGRHAWRLPANLTLQTLGTVELRFRPDFDRQAKPFSHGGMPLVALGVF